MMDDWQDAALSTRHMHNRNTRNRTSSAKHPVFDVRKTFGSYECTCAPWQKLSNAAATEDRRAPRVSLEVYRLTRGGQGVVAEIEMPGVLRAGVVLAGSRGSLRGVVDGLGEEEGDDDDDDEEEEEKEEDGEEEAENNDVEPPPSRFTTFEKNSFRAPKFWLQWSGVPCTGREFETGLGYLVFSGNDCRKFKGTISCASLGWKDVALTGHKLASRSESDIPVTWGEAGAAL